MATVSHTARAVAHRPATATAALAVLGFLGITAIAGGVGFFFDIGMRDPDWLDQIPLVVNWALPGLVLGVGFGLGSLLTAYGVARRPEWVWLSRLERGIGHHWAWLGTLLLGIGMLIWVSLQLVWIDLSFLHVIYGAVGAILVALASTRSLRDYLTYPTR